MDREGPPLESLTHRLAETPPDFLAEPKCGGTGKISVAAVVGDLLDMLGVDGEPVTLDAFAGRDTKDRNRLSIALLFCWLLSDGWFRAAKASAANIVALLDATASELAGQAPALKFLQDPDRREEMARLALARLGFRPAGETIAQAQDRLTSISSTERARVVQAARAAEERARAVREALAKKAAEESADKWTRE